MGMFTHLPVFVPSLIFRQMAVLSLLALLPASSSQLVCM
jgi:hypothetical protein